MNDILLLEKAKEVAQFAYCPYSKAHVGACVLYDNGNIYTGCNVENASYGLTLCAERNAISSAIAKGEKGKIKTVAVWCDDEKNLFVPCGACRQWFGEFPITDDFKVILLDNNSNVLSYSIDDLLPNSFKFL